MASREIGVSRPRHKLWYRSFLTVGRLLMPLARIKLNMKTRPDRRKYELPTLLLYNHVSNADFYCCLDIFRPYTRFIISDAMLRNRVNRILYPIATDFIYRRKGDKADDQVASVIATIEDGVCAGFSSEGGVTPNGATERIRPRTGELVKQCNCGFTTIVLYGSYFIYPTWSHYKAKGPMFGKIINTYTKEQVSKMTVEEVNETIQRDLEFNHYDWNREARIPYIRKNRAEWMERVVNICPKCKTMGKMHSEIDDLYCQECGYKVSVDDYGFFHGDDMVFDNLRDWDMWQRRYLVSQREKWESAPDEIITSDEHFSLSTLVDNMPVIRDEDVKIEMTAREIRITGEKTNLVMPIDEIGGITGAIADGFGITFQDEYYQLKASFPIWNDKQRFIRKVLRHEPIGLDKDGDIV